MAGGRNRSSPSKGDAQTHMTPHLAQNDESPQDLQNHQGTTAAASAAAATTAATTTAASTNAAAPIATTAATTVTSDAASAKEDHGDGKVGNANPVDETTNILSKPYNWIIEGVEGLDEGKICHMNAFYALLKKWIRGKEYTSVLLIKADYDARVNFLLCVKEREIQLAHYFMENMWIRTKIDISTQTNLTTSQE
jgi:hypothetical protein